MKFLDNTFKMGVILSTFLVLFNMFYFEFFRVNIYLLPFSFVFFYILFKNVKVRQFINLFERYEKTFLLLIVVLITLILLNSGIFSDDIITIQDYPIHYFIHWFVFNKAIPEYNSFTGYYLNYQLGYTPIYDHPPGAPFLTTLIYHLFFGIISFNLAFRINVFVSFILPIFSVYFLSKKIGLNSFSTILSIPLYCAWYHRYFLDGTFISYYALSFSLFSLSFFLSYLDKKSNNSLILSAFFLGLTTLFQSMFYPFGLISILFFSLVKKDIKSFIKVFIISLLLDFVYFASVYSWFDYSITIFSKQEKAFSHLYDINRIFGRDFYMLSNLIIIFSLPLLLNIKKKFNEKVFLLFYLSLSILMILFVLNFFQRLQANNIALKLLKIFSSSFLIERGLFFIRPLFSICASYVLYIGLLHFEKEYNLNKILLSLLFSLVFIYLFSFFNYMFEAWKDSESKLSIPILDWTLQDWYSIYYKDGAFAYHVKKDVEELFKYLKDNTDNSARIIIEDSRWGRLGGNIMAISSIFTGRYLVGGLYQGIMIEGDTWFVDGIIFNKNITEYSESEVEKFFNLYNVKWIVIWTNESKNFFSNTNDFIKIFETKNKLFQVYEYKKIPNTYVDYSNGKVRLEILNDNKIILKLADVKTGDKIQLKFRYEKYWHAYQNESEIPIEKCGILMCLKLPKGGSYEIFLVYKEPFLVQIGKIISLLIFISLLILEFYFIVK